MSMISETPIPEVDARQVRRWLAEKRAVLIDIRDPIEHAREHVLGARFVPLEGLDAADFAGDSDKIAVFHCQMGHRTQMAAERLIATAFKEAYALKGGIDGWKSAGLPVHLDRRVPISIMRQVQIAAGGLVFLGAVLAALLSPWFLVLSGVVGAGLMFAGMSGFCGMARVLAAMPWNRAFRIAAPGA
jgi:rhodanese-related sulfurtransferase